MSTKFFYLVIALVFVIGSAAVLSPQSVRAAGPWYVSNAGDDGNNCLSPATPCATINGAIGKALNGDTVYVAEGTYTGTGSEVVLIDRSITLSGGWDAAFAAQNGYSIISGQNARRGVTTNFDTTSTIERFFLQEGNTVGGGAAGIFNNGTLTINSSSIERNRATTDGGGILNLGSLTINNSSINNNTAGTAGGLANGANWFGLPAAANINNSTISGNFADSRGGGIGNAGNSTLNLNNTTVTGNQDIFSPGAGGIYNESGTVTLQNSILADNDLLASIPVNCTGIILSSGFNLIGDTNECSFTPATGDLTNFESNLGSLVGPPGSPKYHPLFAGSPAIDAGNPAGCSDHTGAPLAADQRGVARVGNCDIGSYEFTPPGLASTLAVLGGDHQSTTTTLAFPDLLQVAALDSLGSPASGVTIDFTAPETGPSGTFSDTGTNTTSSVTDESGLANSTVFTANALEGNYVVTASAPGLTAVEFNLEQITRPLNDNLSNAEIVPSLPFSDSKNIDDATIEPNEPHFCGSTAETRSVWYSFTPTSDVAISANMFGSSFSDASLTVWALFGSGYNGLSFVNRTCFGGSLIFNAQAGTTYYFQAESYASGGGELQINLEEVPAPSNNNFADAELVGTLPFSDTVDLTAATNEPDEPQTCQLMTKTVWYALRPTETMSVRVTVQGFMNIYRATGDGISNLQHLHCKRPDGSPTAFRAEAGETYYIQAGAQFSGQQLQIDLQQAFPPANDLFASAQEITSLPFDTTIDLTDTGLEQGEPQVCFGMDRTAWYSIVPAETMSIRVTVQGLTNVYRAVGDGISNLQHVQCGTFDGSPTTFLAEANETYYIQVGPQFSGQVVRINLQQVFPPANDTFANAGEITSLPFSAAPDLTDTGIDPGEPQVCMFLNRTVWYSFAPTETVNVRASTQGFMNIYRATGDGISNLQHMGCLSSENSTSFMAESGQKYYLQVGPLSGGIGTVHVSLQEVLPPPNDGFTNGELITSLPFSVSSNIADASSEPGEPQNCYTMMQTTWFTFTSSQTTRLRADTFGGPFYGNVNLYQAEGPNVSDLRFLNCSGPFSSITFTAEANQTYYFQLGSAFGSVGTVQFNLAEVPVISGRATDAVTGAPLPGNAPPYSYVTLYRVCGDPCLEYVNAQQADGEGRFLFDGYYYGAPLFAGTYQIEITAHMYETRQFGPFEFSGTSLDLGDIGLNPPAVIRGRVVSELTGNPLPGSSVTLYRCDESGCNQYVNSQSADGSGGFLFNSFYYGAPLTGGMYEIEFSANLHVTRRFGVRINGGQDLDLGDVALPPVPLIGSIRGTLLDKATGKPISSTFTPAVNLYRCYDSNCFEFVASQVPDSAGRFRFELDAWGNRIPAGQYQIVAFADQYEQGQTGPFDVAENMHAAIGSLRLVSFPVRFSHVQPCAEIPAAGGECVYSVRIWNGLSQDLEGSAWSMVNGSLPDTFIGYTEFQAKDKKDLDLDRGESRVVQFRFNVPANDSSYGTSLCARAFVGRDGNPNFNTLGIRQLFCVYWNAGGFTIASPEQALAFSQENAAVAASGTELEPNNSCQTAQDVGEPPYPFTLSGELDSSSAPDVDFYRFTGTPGVSVTIDLEGQATGMGTLPDPYLGFFDSNCNLVTTNDDSNGTLNSQLVITVPADGVFVLGATLCCDSGFFGGGNGTYQLTVAPVQTINSISGLVADFQTGRPLRGDAEPFAFVQLIRCTDTACFYMAGQPVGSDGRFRFTRDFNGAPLPVGNYRLELFATQYFFSQAGPFTVGEGEEFDVGEIRLTSFPVRFSSVNACTVPSNGGTCEFSVKITNGLPSRLSGRVWSVVDGFNLGSPANATTFQTGSTRDLRLDPGKSATVRFQFHVPGSVADGATICSRVYVGQNPDAQYNTVGLSYVFCIVKDSTGFTVLSDLEAQTFLQSQQILQLNTLQTPGPSIKKPE